jgi:hypothetical protein
MEESLRVFLEDPARRAQLASEGRKTVLTNYDLPIMVDHYCQLYENLINGR